MKAPSQESSACRLHTQLQSMTASVIVRRLAALSGASAVTAGAYGAHGRDSTLAYALYACTSFPVGLGSKTVK